MRPEHAAPPPDGPRLVVGVDAGGTRTRVLLATLAGTPVGCGEAGGANARSSSGDVAAHLDAALRSALDGAVPRRVVAGVVAMAGAGAAGLDQARAVARQAWHGVGLPGEPDVVPDVLAAFHAGTPAASGSVLVAGTGAVAACVRDGAVVRRADGRGWLLGDDGSAVWLGRQAARAALAALDGRGEATSLTPLVAHALDVPVRDDPLGYDLEAVAQGIVGAVHDRSPADLGLLAPLVSEAAAHGDRVARRLVDTGVAHLLASLDTVHDEGPVVLAGALLLSPGPVAAAVRTGVREQYDVDPCLARDGAAGAAAMALAAHTRAPVASDVHGRLCAPLSST